MKENSGRFIRRFVFAVSGFNNFGIGIFNRFLYLGNRRIAVVNIYVFILCRSCRRRSDRVRSLFEKSEKGGGRFFRMALFYAALFLENGVFIRGLE